MSEKHTPGPWRVETDTTLIWGDSASKLSIPVAEARGNEAYRRWGRYMRESEIAANIRLIAAAPDLLEALNKITDQMDRNRGRCDVATYNLACDAIEKAEGEAE